MLKYLTQVFDFALQIDIPMSLYNIDIFPILVFIFANCTHEFVSYAHNISYGAAPCNDRLPTGCAGYVYKMSIEAQPTTMVTINPKERN